MKEYIFDKSILLIIQTVLAIVLYSQADYIFAFDVLIAISILSITEINKKNTVAIVAAVFSVFLSFLLKDVYIMFSVAVYSLFSSREMNGLVNKIIEYYNLKNMKRVNYRKEISVERIEMKEVIMFCCNLLLTVVSLIKCGNETTCVVIIVAAIAMSLSTSRRLYKYNRVKQLYDQSRLEKYGVQKKSEEMLQSVDENIYMATLEERNRIAREIHDNVGHMLTRAIVQMQAIKVVNKDENVKPLIDSVDETVNQAMLNIRRSVHELHDDSIDISIMTNELLRTLPERFEKVCKTSIESAISSELKNAVLSIIKEAITNIVKYSDGDKVTVEIIEHTAFWRIYISDNGKNEVKEYDSFYRDSVDKGIGLSNIYTRVKKLGGRVNINSDENGFYVLATINK